MAVKAGVGLRSAANGSGREGKPSFRHFASLVSWRTIQLCRSDKPQVPPLMPQNCVVLDVEYQATPQWSIGADAKFVSSQFLVGDELNQEAPLPAYGVVNLHTSLKVNKWATFFVEIDNLFNRTYYTFGAFTQLDNLPPNLNLTDPTTLSPSPGRLVYAGRACHLLEQIALGKH